MTQEILAGFFFLGSFSLGYAVLRIGFPAKQRDSIVSKIIFGYVIGALIIAIGLIASVLVGEVFFPAGIMIGALLSLVIAYTIKSTNNQEDLAIANEFDKKRTKKRITPKKLEAKAITKETREKVNIREVLKKYKKEGNEQAFKEKKANNSTEEDKRSALEKLKKTAQELFKKKSAQEEFEEIK